MSSPDQKPGGGDETVLAPVEPIGLLGEWVAAYNTIPDEWRRRFASGLLLAALLREMDGSPASDRVRHLITEAVRHAR